MKTIRCAIYTRKSSDEGLEQAFNSLDAQREACAAYVLSQASEGWVALPDIYDDGGLSRCSALPCRGCSPRWLPTGSTSSWSIRSTG